MPNWFLIPEYGVAIGAAQKCGTRSITYSIVKARDPRTEYERLSPSAVPHIMAHNPKGLLRVGVIREPVDRFASLWRCQVRDGKPGVLPQSRRNPCLITPERLFDMADARNPHFDHQHKTLKDADVLVRFEDFPLWWDQNIPIRLYHKNGSDGKAPISKELEQRILRLYSIDRELYECCKLLS